MSPRPIGAICPELHDWLHQGMPFPATSRGRLRTYRWSSLFFRLNLAMQDRLSPAAALGDDPILVLGAWRSGTTWLHELLACHPNLCTPRTWQCMAPSTFALTGPPRRDVELLRPMDDFTISSLSPQEDEFALLAMGAPSLYRAFLDPRRLKELAPLLRESSWLPGFPGEARWLSFLGTVLACQGPAASRLLLKSPNHSYRRPALLAQFPALRACWIVRDPVHIWMSNRRLWASMALLYGLAPLDPDDLDHFMVEVIDSTAEALTAWCASLPTDRLVVVSFSDLKERPLRQSLSLMDRLGLAQSPSTAPALEQAIAKRAQVRSASQRGQLDPPPPTDMDSPLGRALNALQHAQQAALRSHGL